MGLLPWPRMQTCILVISDILQFNVFPIVYKYSIIYLLNITVIIFKCLCMCSQYGGLQCFGVGQYLITILLLGLWLFLHLISINYLLVYFRNCIYLVVNLWNTITLIMNN